MAVNGYEIQWLSIFYLAYAWIYRCFQARYVYKRYAYEK